MEQRAAMVAAKTAETLNFTAKGTATATALCGLTIAEWASIVGIVAAFIGIIATLALTAVSIHYKRKAYLLDKARTLHGGVKEEEILTSYDA